MAASSSSAGESWLSSTQYTVLEEKNIRAPYAEMYKVKENATTKVFAIKRFRPQKGPGAKRFRQTIEFEGKMVLAVQGGVSRAIRE
jgi:hypothetical protein